MTVVFIRLLSALSLLSLANCAPRARDDGQSSSGDDSNPWSELNAVLVDSSGSALPYADLESKFNEPLPSQYDQLSPTTSTPQDASGSTSLLPQPSASSRFGLGGGSYGSGGYGAGSDSLPIITPGAQYPGGSGSVIIPSGPSTGSVPYITDGAPFQNVTAPSSVPESLSFPEPSGGSTPELPSDNVPSSDKLQLTRRRRRRLRAKRAWQ